MRQKKRPYKLVRMKFIRVEKFDERSGKVKTKYYRDTEKNRIKHDGSIVGTAVFTVKQYLEED